MRSSLRSQKGCSAAKEKNKTAAAQAKPPFPQVPALRKKIRLRKNNLFTLPG